MAPPKKPSLTPLQTAVLVGQLIGILIALGLYAVDLGRRDATLTRIASDTQELRVIAADLTKAVIRGQAIEQQHTESIAALALRIEKLTTK
jgi:hypothetical protein